MMFNLKNLYIPELPAAKRKRFEKQYGLSPEMADAMTCTRAFADYFEECCTLYNNPQLIAKWMKNEKNFF